MNSRANSPPPAPFIDSYLAYLLARASQQVSATFHAELASLGVSVAEWRVLACLYSFPALGIGEIARRAIMQQPRITKMIDRLEAQGLVARAADAPDRRRVQVRLTPAGLARVAPLVAAARAHEARVLAPLSEKERAVVKHALDLLIG